MIDLSDIVLRLGAAALAGGAIGLNRDLHGKPIGVRTLGLVGLATAMVVLLADPIGNGGFTDAGSRVIQGILTGIGFLGAGVIYHTQRHVRVHGLTSAACAWLTACVGIMCGAGHWRIVTVSLVITFVILLFGGRVESALHKALGGKAGHAPGTPDQSSDTGPHQPGR
ncbi:MgtC/SapB family protein [Xanthomonas graminis]|uniref:Protein MgtC n=1 Tax=Xanthomonas graminis pv. phlei TaxID=487906 RepID=A0A0K3A0W9_9XANT|nr:MgtC/SapB family protein [Xanthomonas translucens]UKE65553.1 MgtC/SapB family protein [Xanthomonas translucens pv. phlei]CTP90937.1 MgtC/SapB transporter [Xanthomonas translucens pv. phlei]